MFEILGFRKSRLLTRGAKVREEKEFADKFWASAGGYQTFKIVRVLRMVAHNENFLVVFACEQGYFHVSQTQLAKIYVMHRD